MSCEHLQGNVLYCAECEKNKASRIEQLENENALLLKNGCGGLVKSLRADIHKLKEEIELLKALHIDDIRDLDREIKELEKLKETSLANNKRLADAVEQQQADIQALAEALGESADELPMDCIEGVCIEHDDYKKYKALAAKHLNHSIESAAEHDLSELKR